MIRALVFALALAPMFVQAQDAQLFRRAKTSCSARAIDRLYFDNGCSVTFKNGQRAVCLEATCDSNQSGEPVYSRCECR
jgi:hypothetical protein